MGVTTRCVHSASVPGVIDEHDGVELLPGLGIFKGSVVFRDVRELHDQDIDFAVLAKGEDGDGQAD